MGGKGGFPKNHSFLSIKYINIYNIRKNLIERKNMNNRIKAILAIVGLSLGVFVGLSATQKKDCIQVYVDYGILDKSTFDECLPTTSDINALDLLKSNNFTLQGTEKYGEAVVCRLNALPKIAECKEMPSEKAYWAILEKRDQILFEDYVWAQVGINELILSPGDSLALVFANNGTVNFPE